MVRTSTYLTNQRGYVYLWCFLLSLLASPSLLAQPIAQVYRNDVGLHGSMLAIGASLTTVGIVLDRKTEPVTDRYLDDLSIEQVIGIDRYSTRHFSWKAASFSDGLVLASFSAPFFLLTDRPGRENFSRASLIVFQGLLLNSGITGLTKALVRRPRPYLFNPMAPNGFKYKKNARYSFFSGHAATTAYFTFVTATMFNDIYPDSRLRPYVWSTAAILPALTAYGRMRGGRHYFTDVLVGYTVGALVGILIPSLYR